MAASKTNTQIQSDGRLWQVIITFKETYRVGFHKEQLAYPFYSPNVFVNQKDAERYIPIFLHSLIKAGDLPPEVIKNNVIDEELIKTAIWPVLITALEVDDEEN